MPAYKKNLTGFIPCSNNGGKAN